VTGDLNPLFDSFLARARLLEEQGVPFPVTGIRAAFMKALLGEDKSKALHVLERAERLYHSTYTQWVPVRDLLSRGEVLRATAEELGIDLAASSVDLGNPRAFVHAGPLSSELFARAGEMAKANIAELRRAIIRSSKEEAAKLGGTIQLAQRRGENVKAATVAFGELLRALKGEPSPVLVQRISACRKLVGEIPSAPVVAFPGIEDADEILLEARILARRIHRIKRNAHDAQSAARLMSHVRAALSEDRRSASPQDEIEELWGEVTRLSKERRATEPAGTTAPAIPPPMRAEKELTSPYALPLSSGTSDPADAGAPNDGRTRRRTPAR
jgi:hypothetical protein